jgi:hypothetical protein
LRAYDATDLHRLLYEGSLAPTRGQPLGYVIKFSVPTIANAMVYVGTQNSLVGYGLHPRNARNRPR